ncbi:hypothetical protein [Cytobacillus massiliigabonensis]|uniref:hypothetical protein n=1 Tax=Cytobacillus massiliigabonensis TaxID=1871011 RepID=UPI000C850279|nr:hypothetical protein [Cytobacillus massiliigabonensis]
MDYVTNARLLELVYDGRTYEFLEFIRIDRICEITYITLKNVITAEMFTFDENKIRSIRMKIHPHSRENLKNQESSCS